jgi:hypothetical protein
MRILDEKLIKKFFALYRAQKSITVFTKAPSH